jgi:hypothetical protein
MTISGPQYKRLRWALAQKAITLGVKIPEGYKTISEAPPGEPMRQLIYDVEVAAKQRGLYSGATDGTLNTAFQHYLIPPAALDVNALAAKWMLANLGPKENLGPNRGTWLNAVEDAMGDSWMHAGEEPWCADVGGRAALIHAGIDVHQLFPDLNYAGCPSWVQYTRAGAASTHADPQDGHRYRFVLVSRTAEALRFGDHLLFDWPGESPGVADHYGRFLTDAGGGAVHTVEANTTSGVGGNQSDGGGIYQRVRALSEVLCAGRILRAVT